MRMEIYMKVTYSMLALGYLKFTMPNKSGKLTYAITSEVSMNQLYVSY